MKTALLFSGQGSQSVGMAEGFIENDSEWFGRVCDTLDLPLRQIILEGPEEKLEDTRITQPAMFVVNHLIYRFLSSHTLKADMYAGHSLGEYNALVAANWASFEDLLNVVSIRGRAMADAAESANGGMAAILKLDPDEIDSLCNDISTDPSITGTVEIALYNSPSEIVISGAGEALDLAIDRADEAGALKAVQLEVSGPWHSKYMAPAQEPLGEALDDVNWIDDGNPVIANVTGKLISSDSPEQTLLDQLTRPVQWIKSIHTLLESGVSRFIEVGPGEVLCGLVDRISRQTKFEPEIEATDTIDQTRELIEGVRV